MFDTKTNPSERLADAVDLLIDFATLGEYGLESVETPAPRCEGRLSRSSRSTGSWRAAIDRFTVQA